MLNQQRRQLKQLNAQRLVVCGELLSSEQSVDYGRDDVLRKYLIKKSISFFPGGRQAEGFSFSLWLEGEFED